MHAKYVRFFRDVLSSLISTFHRMSYSIVRMCLMHQKKDKKNASSSERQESKLEVSNPSLKQ